MIGDESDKAIAEAEARDKAAEEERLRNRPKTIAQKLSVIFSTLRLLCTVPHPVRRYPYPIPIHPNPSRGLTYFMIYLSSNKTDLYQT